MKRLMVHLLLLTLAIFHKKTFISVYYYVWTFTGVRGEIDWGHGYAFATRLGWSKSAERQPVEPSPASAEGAKPTGGGLGPSPRKFWKIDCRKRVFQAFQVQCSSEHSTTINKTPHEVRLPRNPPRQNHLSFPTNADLRDNLPTRRHAQPITYPKTPR